MRLWAVVKVPSQGDSVIQGKSPGQLVLEMGICSEMLVVGAVVTEIAVLPTQPGGEASRILRGCSSKPVGVPALSDPFPHLISDPADCFPFLGRLLYCGKENLI